MNKKFTQILLILSLFLSTRILADYYYAVNNYELEGIKIDVTDIKNFHLLYPKWDTDENMKELLKRSISNFCNRLDSYKTYFISTDTFNYKGSNYNLTNLLNPTDELLTNVLSDFNNNNFDLYFEICNTFTAAVDRRNNLTFAPALSNEELPPGIRSYDNWCSNENDLKDRLTTLDSDLTDTKNTLDHEWTDGNPSIADTLIQNNRENFENGLFINNDPNSALDNQKVWPIILEAIAGSFDAYTKYYNPIEARSLYPEAGVGIYISSDPLGIKVDEVIESSPAYGKLKAGDRIIEVKKDTNSDYYNAYTWQQGANLIVGDDNTSVFLKIKRLNNGSIQDGTIEITRDSTQTLQQSSVILETFQNGYIANIYLYDFTTNNIDYVIEKLNEYKSNNNIYGIILDLRNNGGGLINLTTKLLSLFSKTACTERELFATNPAIYDGIMNIDNLLFSNIPMIVLINRNAASASEITTQYLQDLGIGIIVGDEQTYGKGIGQYILDYVNSLDEYIGMIKITKFYFYTTSGKCPQIQGVKNNIFVPGVYNYQDIGMQFEENPIPESENISPIYQDFLRYLDDFERRIKIYKYRYNRQAKNDLSSIINTLKEKSEKRILEDSDYQEFITLIQISNPTEEQQARINELNQNDLQLTEARNILADWINL